MAFEKYLRHICPTASKLGLDKSRYEVTNNPELPPKLMRTKLRAIDRYSMVILGDPVVALPQLVGKFC